ncbi:MAG: hypothetical protein Q8L29_02445 [archaeon]|nr:hypothetical protein [archaeon]
MVGAIGDKLREKLFSNDIVYRMCPFIQKDLMGAYCGKGLLNGDRIREERRTICDVISLPMWCLSRNYRECRFYKGGF